MYLDSPFMKQKPQSVLFALLWKHSLLILLAIILSACPANQYRYSAEHILPGSVLRKVTEEGKLRAITQYSPTTYFIYRGEPMGFHYELLHRFTSEHGLELELVTATDLGETFSLLLEQEVDVVAMDLTVTRERSQWMRFIHPHNQTRQVLVQRKQGLVPAGRDDIQTPFIRNPLDLGGKTIIIQKGSSYLNRLRHLQEEIGDSIRVVEHPDYSVERLIRMLARGEIDYTVADENVALMNRTWYPNLDVRTAISFKQNLAWAVHPGADSLQGLMNAWMKEFTTTTAFRQLYDKYFRSKKMLDLAEAEFLSDESGVISVYDEVIKETSKIIGWDWRLIASLIFQESRFHPEVRSWTGAFGLMQLMPETAAELGVDTASSPEEQIEAGVRYLKILDRQLEEQIPDPEERKKFVLAAYNVGIGHVLDARRLAEKNGRDTNVWFRNVDTFLLQKSFPEYYNDPVVYYGYCRGEEPVAFVAEILQRFRLYLDVIPE